MRADPSFGRRDLLLFPSRRAAPTPAGDDQWIRVFRAAMACRFEVTLSGEDAHHIAAARVALAEADRLESALSVFRDTSDLVRVNRAAADAPAGVDAELFALLARCATLHAETDGAFDVTSTPLSRCWGFLAREGCLPEPAALDAARALVGMPHVRLDEEAKTVCFARPGMELNLGSIGKGYAVQQIGERLRARGVRRALVSAGGSSVLAIGGGRLRPASRSAPAGWPIDLRVRYSPESSAAPSPTRGNAAGTGAAGGDVVSAGHGREPGAGGASSAPGPASDRARLPSVAGPCATAIVARVWLRDGALGTSGAGEQFAIIDGRRYGHVLDPRTGWPSTAGLISASVITQDAATADALATAFFVGGRALAERYCAAHPGTLAILTEEADPRRPHVFGAYDGVTIDAARPTGTTPHTSRRTVP